MYIPRPEAKERKKLKPCSGGLTSFYRNFPYLTMQ